MNDKDKEEAMVQNLKDAGCTDDMIAFFLEDIRRGRPNEGLKRLALHRQSLLNNIHKAQKQIDCLDYLVYTMQKQA